MIRGTKALLLALLLLTARQALADCTTTNGTVTLPGSSSFAVYNGSLSAQGTAGLNCSGLGLSLLTQNTVTVKINSTTHNMALANTDGSGDQIPYLIYPDANYQYPYSVGQTIDYSSLNLLTLILISPNVNFRCISKLPPGLTCAQVPIPIPSTWCGITISAAWV